MCIYYVINTLGGHLIRLIFIYRYLLRDISINGFAVQSDFFFKLSLESVCQSSLRTRADKSFRLIAKCTLVD